MIAVVRRLFASPRRRRRMFRFGLAGIVVAGIAAVIVLFPNTAPKFPEARDEQAVAPTDEEPEPWTRERSQAVDAIVHRFVRHALLRQDPVKAWPLATREFRAGSTRNDWAHGELPVSPYPASDFRRATWRVAYTFRDLIGVDVTVVPKVRSAGTIWIYAVELRREPRNGRRPWRVDMWFPLRSVGGGTVAPPPPRLSARERRAAEAREAAERRAREEAEELTEKSRISRAWWLVPIALLALIAAVPAAFGVRSVVQARRAERRYRS